MLLRFLQIGPHKIEPATVLAPMAGVTDTVFRRLIRSQGGCGLIMTEFTSSHGVVATSKAAASEANRRAAELGGQAIGLRAASSPAIARKPTRTFRYLYF